MKLSNPTDSSIWFAEKLILSSHFAKPFDMVVLIDPVSRNLHGASLLGSTPALSLLKTVQDALKESTVPDRICTDLISPCTADLFLPGVHHLDFSLPYMVHPHLRGCSERILQLFRCFICSYPHEEVFSSPKTLSSALASMVREFNDLISSSLHAKEAGCHA